MSIILIDHNTRFTEYSFEMALVILNIDPLEVRKYCIKSLSSRHLNLDMLIYLKPIKISIKQDISLSILFCMYERCRKVPNPTKRDQSRAVSSRAHCFWAHYLRGTFSPGHIFSESFFLLGHIAFRVTMSLGHVVSRGKLSQGHIVCRGTLSSGAHYLPGHIVSRGILSPGRVVSGAHCLGGILSLGRLSPGRVVSGAGCLRGGLSPGHIVSGADCLPGQIISGADYLGADCLGAHCLGADCLGANCLGAPCPNT